MKSIFLIVLALGCGLVAAVGVLQHMGKTGAATIESQGVLVAVEEININESLNEENVQLVEWPRDRVPVGTITDWSQLEGKLARIRLYPGEPIMQGKVMDLDDAGGSLKVPLGYRVASVRVTSASSVSNLIEPGDRVDVVVVLRESRENMLAMSRTILKAVRVFAVNSEMEKNVERENGLEETQTVSLLLQPEQVETLAMADELGTIKLALRSPDDPNVDETNGCTVEKIVGRSSVADETDAGGALALRSQLLASVAPTASAPEEETPRQPKWRMSVMSPGTSQQYHWYDQETRPELVDGDLTAVRKVGNDPADTAGEPDNSDNRVSSRNPVLKLADDGSDALARSH